MLACGTPSGQAVDVTPRVIGQNVLFAFGGIAPSEGDYRVTLTTGAHVCEAKTFRFVPEVPRQMIMACNGPAAAELIKHAAAARQRQLEDIDKQKLAIADQEYECLKAWFDKPSVQLRCQERLEALQESLAEIVARDPDQALRRKVRISIKSES